MDELPAGFVIRGQGDELPPGFAVRGQRSFMQQAGQPLNDVPDIAEQERQVGLARLTAPLPQGNYGKDYMIPRDIAQGVGDVLSRAGGAAQYVSSPITGLVRGLASKPIADTAVSAGVPRDVATDWIQTPIDVVGAAAIPFGVEKYGPSAINAVKNSALLADETSGAIPVPFTKTGPNVKAGWSASDVDELNAAKEAGHKVVNDAYQVPSLKAATLTPEASTQLNTNIISKFDQSNIDPVNSPKTIAAVKQLNDRLSNGFTHPITGELTPSAPISVSELDGFRKKLGKITGEDSAAAGEVRSAIDEFLNSADQTHLANGTPQAIQDLNNARTTAKANFKYQDVADVLVKANGDPAKIQRGLTKFLSDPENTNGMSDEALSALKEAANGTNGQRVMQLLGKLGFGTANTLGSAGVAALSYPILGPIGAPVALGVNTAMRYGNKLAVRGAAENALKSMTPAQAMQLTPAQAMKLGIKP